MFFYFRAPWRKFVPHLSDGDGVQVKSPDADGIFLVAKDDLGMFITTYFPDKGETAAQFTPPYCREVLTKAIGEQIEIEIIEVAAWQPYEQVADQFQLWASLSRRRLRAHHAAIQGRGSQHRHSKRA